MDKEKVIKLIGLIFLIWGVVAVIDNIFKLDEGIAPTLWISYICLIVIGIGILNKDANLVASQVAIIGIPYLLWNIDFFYQLITKESLFGLTDYFFREGSITGKIITLQHIFNLPLSLFSIYLIKLKRTDFWKISCVQVIIIFLITRIVTNYEQNVNCVYHNCANFDFGLPYVIEWFIAYFIMIYLMRLIIVRLFRKEISLKKAKEKK